MSDVHSLTPPSGQPSATDRLSSSAANAVIRPALLVGLVGLVAAIAYAFVGGANAFFQAYLYGYLFWLGFPIASIGILWINHLAPGTWGLILRRPLEASAATIALMIVLAIPLFSPTGLRALYPWAKAQVAGVTGHDEAEHAGEVHAASEGEVHDHEHEPTVVERPATAHLAAGSEHSTRPARFEPHTGFVSPMGHKAKWFARPFFYGRLVGYFVLWGLMAFVLNRWSANQDRTTNPSPSARLKSLSPFGLILLFLAGTFAMFDWSMSLDTNWYSTIYGAMLLVGMAQATLAFTLIVLSRLVDQGHLTHILTPTRLRDLGNMLLALTMLWAYTSFSQFLIIWSGNIAEEVSWYLKRSQGGWQFVVAFLMAVGFFFPFLVLLFRKTKQTTSNLRRVAGLILLIHVVDIFWIIGPDIGFESVTVPVQGLLVLLGMGGLWLALYTYFLKSKPLVSANDPAMIALREYDLAHAHAHGHAHPA